MYEGSSRRSNELACFDLLGKGLNVRQNDGLLISLGVRALGLELQSSFCPRWIDLNDRIDRKSVANASFKTFGDVPWAWV